MLTMTPHLDEEFRDFVAARGHALIRTAYLLTGDQQHAEDLVQAALEKAARHGAPSAPPSPPRPTCARRCTASRSPCGDGDGSEMPLAAVPEPRRPDDVSAETDVQRLVLQQALMALGRRQRTVVVLRYFEDLTEQQVADALGISVGTVKSQAHKALGRLREICRDLAPTTGGGPR